MLVDLRSTPLSVDEVLNAVRHPGAGAIDLFLGIVRDSNEGHPVSDLEYSAYASMAVAEMKRIAEEIEAQFPGCRVSVVHRIGPLRVGDAAVVCAASAPHRDEAFRACRALIDAIKERAPIWKKEKGPDGSHWVGWTDGSADGPKVVSPGSEDPPA